MVPTRYPGIMKIAQNTYLIRVRVKDPRTGKLKGVRRTRECTLKQAVGLQAVWRAEARRTAADTKRERQKLAQYARSWMTIKLPNLKPSTAKGYGKILDNHVLPRFGEYYVDVITPLDVKAWVAELSDRYAGNTVRNSFRLLRQIFLDAVDDLGLAKDPCARVELPELHRWTEDDPNLFANPKHLSTLLEGFHEHEAEWYPLAATLAWTGLRFGEATALEWDDLDEHKAVIRVRRAQWRGIVGKPKGKGERTVPLVSELAEILKEHRRSIEAKQDEESRTNLVFPSRTGEYFQPGALRKPLMHVLAEKKLPRITVHGLRRTLNNFVRQHAPGIVTRSIMGHVSEVMTNHYSIAGAEEKKAAVAAVVQLVRGSGGPSGGPSANETDLQERKAK